MPAKSPFFLVLLVLLLIPASASAAMNRTFDADDQVHLNITYVLDQSGATPFDVWAGAIIIGLALLVLSCWHFPGGEEDFISVLAWIPIGFAMFTSLAVDRVTSYGMTGMMVNATAPKGIILHEYALMENHTIYNWWPMGVILFVILVFAFANTYRIVHAARKESLPQQVQEGGSL